MIGQSIKRQKMNQHVCVYKILGDISSSVPSTSRFGGTVRSCPPLKSPLCCNRFNLFIGLTCYLFFAYYRNNLLWHCMSLFVLKCRYETAHSLDAVWVTFLLLFSDYVEGRKWCSTLFRVERMDFIRFLGISGCRKRRLLWFTCVMAAVSAFLVETTAAETANLCQCPRLRGKIPLIRPIWGPPAWLFLDILRPASVSGWMLGAVIASRMRAVSSGLWHFFHHQNLINCC